MSHVDEGALHAYLDGALDEYPAAEARRVREHLETCAVCAERLAEERRVREDARAILDLAAPKVEIPTFEELRAYVRAGRSQRAALGRIHKMGWAASVVLALGTGWFLRGGPVDPLRTFEAEQSAPSAASPERAADAAPTSTTAVAPEAQEEVVDQTGAAARTPTTVAAEPQPRPAAPLERAAADAPAAGGAGNRAEQLAQAPAAVTAPPPTPSPEPATVSAAGGRSLTDAPAPLGAGAVGGAVAGFDDRQADAARVQARLDSAARMAESRRRISADQVVTSALDAPPSVPTLERTRAANEVERDQDEMEEGESLVVPGLQVLTVENLGEGTAFAGTRSLQRLASGDTLEVIHLPEGVEPTLLAPPRTGHNQIVRQHPDGWLVMRAPLGPIELEQLLERLEAGR
jgi:hypothetical protein